MSTMTDVTEKLSSPILGKITESTAYGYLDNSEFEVDTFEPVGSEESDTDASTDSTGNNLEKIEELPNGAKGVKNDPNFIARHQNDNDLQVADYESEITFLKLKMKLLIKESTEEYNEVHFFSIRNTAHFRILQVTESNWTASHTIVFFSYALDLKDRKTP